MEKQVHTIILIGPSDERAGVLSYRKKNIVSLLKEIENLRLIIFF